MRGERNKRIFENESLHKLKLKGSHENLLISIIQNCNIKLHAYTHWVRETWIPTEGYLFESDEMESSLKIQFITMITSFKVHINQILMNLSFLAQTSSSSHKWIVKSIEFLSFVA